MPALRFENVAKTFSLHRGRALLATHIRQAFGGRGDRANELRALSGISFSVEHGESICIVGHNGAGKSTLLSLIAGLSPPDEGKVTVNGRVAALLELGSGFHPDLTGEENAVLNASLIGLGRERTTGLLPQIYEFAGLGDFIKEPLRTYSAGMIMRLAFSVAVHADPEILLIDEVLAVGDKSFQEKCIARIWQFRQQMKTLVFVTHGYELLKELCNRALWLDHGRLMLDGPLDEVLTAYYRHIHPPAAS